MRSAILLLHEHRDALEALRLDERGDGRRRDVVGQVRAHDGREACEFFTHKRRDIGFQNIGGHDLEVVKAGHGLVQDRQQRLVKLHGHHLARALAELVAQCADAGADLEHAVLLVCARALGDLIGDGGVDQKVLPHGLGKMKTVAL